MIAEYVDDALAGEDREYAPQLMRREAPLNIEWSRPGRFLLLVPTMYLREKQAVHIF
jgi:hypothetical protein